uniref:Uncharacterized protein n=1 Tax=Chelydra serpentina TaxID=8475 RepID=A0A8C3SL73_CHESE
MPPQCPPVPPHRPPAGLELQCVLLGDGAVGKTSLAVSYSANGYPARYVPTALDRFSAVVQVDSAPVRLHLCDTAGQVRAQLGSPFNPAPAAGPTPSARLSPSARGVLGEGTNLPGSGLQPLRTAALSLPWEGS